MPLAQPGHLAPSCATAPVSLLIAPLPCPPRRPQVDGKTVFTSDHALKMEWLPNWWVPWGWQHSAFLSQQLPVHCTSSRGLPPYRYAPCRPLVKPPSTPAPPLPPAPPSRGRQDRHHRLGLHRPGVLRRLHRAGLRGAGRPLARGGAGVEGGAASFNSYGNSRAVCPSSERCCALRGTLLPSAPSPPTFRLGTHACRRSRLWRRCPTSCPGLTARSPSWRSAC